MVELPDDGPIDADRHGLAVFGLAGELRGSTCSGTGGDVVAAVDRRQWLGAMTAESAKPRLRSASRAELATAAESALVREAQRGSTEALEELFRRHWRRAHRAAYLVVGDPAAAEDIAQESFLAAIRALDRFDRRRPFGPWLHRITVNRAIDFARARAARGESALGRPARGRGAGGRAPLSDELVRRSRRARARAPRGGRAPLRARVHAGRDRRDARLPRGTVNSRLRRGLDRLRPAIEEASR